MSHGLCKSNHDAHPTLLDVYGGRAGGTAERDRSSRKEVSWGVCVILWVPDLMFFGFLKNKNVVTYYLRVLSPPPPPYSWRTNLGILRNAKWVLSSEILALVDDPQTPINRRAERRWLALRVTGRRELRPGRRLQCPHVRSFLLQGPALPFSASVFRLPFPVGEAGALERGSRDAQVCVFSSTEAGPTAVSPADFLRRTLLKRPVLRDKVCKVLG